MATHDMHVKKDIDNCYEIMIKNPRNHNSCYTSLKVESLINKLHYCRRTDYRKA